MKTIAVTGGAGYVGSVLVPKLLAHGWNVRVLDLFLYGEDVFNGTARHPGLTRVRGDIRDAGTVSRTFEGCDAVLHLACISNDPSFELDPDLGKSINYDCFKPMVERARDAGVRRFVFASSSSVYGVKDDDNVTEDLSLEPLTDYSKFKALCEEILLRFEAPDFAPVILRPATVCGYGPRLRLDLAVNILTNHAYNTGRIRVFGGAQKRPNIHIEDVTDAYIELLERPAEDVAGKIYNAGCSNHTIARIAEIVKCAVDRPGIEVVTEPTNDHRSYHISSEKIRNELGFAPRRTIEDAVADLCNAFASGKVPNPLTDDRYYNVNLMKAVNLR